MTAMSHIPTLSRVFSRANPVPRGICSAFQHHIRTSGSAYFCMPASSSVSGPRMSRWMLGAVAVVGGLTATFIYFKSRKKPRVHEGFRTMLVHDDEVLWYAQENEYEYFVRMELERTNAMAQQEYLMPLVENEDANTMAMTQDEYAMAFVEKKKHVTFQKLLKKFTTLEECTICIDALRATGVARQQQIIMLSCGHVFHTNCIASWFNEKTDCPICRMVDPDCIFQDVTCQFTRQTDVGRPKRRRKRKRRQLNYQWPVT